MLIKDPTAQIYIQEALKLTLKTEVIDKQGLLKISRGKKNYFIFKARTPLNSITSTIVSNNKYFTFKILRKAKLPVLKQHIVSSEKKLAAVFKSTTFPLVVKPKVGSRGAAVFVKLVNKQQVLSAFKKAKKYCREVIIENYFVGQDFRFLVLNNQVIAIIQRQPPKIIGDGKSSILKLIKIENQKRLDSNKRLKNPLKNKIVIGNISLKYLNAKNLSLSSILQKNQILQLKRKANISTGGTATVLKEGFFHHTFAKGTIQATQALGLKLTAIDLLIKNPKKPFCKNNSVIIESNSAPGLTPFYYPQFGKPQPVGEKILKFMVGQS